MLFTNNDMLELCNIADQIELTQEEKETIELIRNIHLNREEISNVFYEMFLELLIQLKNRIVYTFNHWPKKTICVIRKCRGYDQVLMIEQWKYKEYSGCFSII